MRPTTSDVKRARRDLLRHPNRPLTARNAKLSSVDHRKASHVAAYPTDLKKAAL